MFYILFKIHKQPWATRPVVSCCGSLLAAVSTWIDIWLQNIKHLVPGYFKDSDSLMFFLKNIENLHPWAKLFTCDATAMYTNIDIAHLLKVITGWLDVHRTHLPLGFPTATILAALELVMKNNIFQFGDTYWRQNIGTAMGTPCACIIATIYFSHYEKFILLPRYKKYLPHYYRFIDDGIGIWAPKDNPNSSLKNALDSTVHFNNFKEDLSKFGILRWTCEDLSNEVIYLDLIIQLNKGKFKFKTYQKNLNLYLYIPPHSAHPPGVQKSLVYGCLQKYWKQNSDVEDYKRITRLFFDRLQTRGHEPSNLRTIFLDAASKLKPRNFLFNKQLKTQNVDKEKEEKEKNDLDDDGEELFFKYIFHPKDISRLTLRSLYEDTCEVAHENSDGFKNFRISKTVSMKVKKLTIAYRRDENLKDRITPSRLYQNPDNPASSYLH